MAGRFIVLEFTDRDAAAMFEVNEHISQQLGYRIVGVFARPETYCDCPEKGMGKRPGRVHLDNWVRGKRTGLMICRNCRRVSRYHMNGLLKRIEEYFGYNLMAVEHEEK